VSLASRLHHAIPGLLKDNCECYDSHLKANFRQKFLFLTGQLKWISCMLIKNLFAGLYHGNVRAHDGILPLANMIIGAKSARIQNRALRYSIRRN